MKCMRCGEEMRNTIGGCYTCDNCGFAVNDCVLRMSFKNGKIGREIDNIIDGKDLIGTGKITDVTINGESFEKGEVWDKTTYVETDEGLRNKIKDLEHQLSEKDNLIEELQTQNKELLESAKQMLYEGKEVMQSIRHQVCKEIREKLFMLCDWYEDEIGGYWYATEKKINYVLNQIEQGESDAKN